MKVHLLIEGTDRARCGRAGENAAWTARNAEVTCNACRRSIGMDKIKFAMKKMEIVESTQPEPAFGQIWEDVKNQIQGRLRLIRIVRVDPHYVYFYSLNDVIRSEPRKAIRQRFQGDARGYRYFKANA